MPMMWMAKAIMSFIMPGLIAAVSGAVSGFGVTGKMDWQTALTMIVTGLVTYIVPNAKKT